MNNIKLLPVIDNINITLEVPGSKSITNRMLLLSAVADGESIISNINSSEDVNLMLQALINLGVEIVQLSNNYNSCTYKIIGCNGKFPIKNYEIFCGNSGITMRLLSGALSVMDGSYLLTGTKRMKERPIADLFHALKQIGVQIDYLEKQGFPPLKISSFKNNNNHDISISGINSSQYLSSLLIAVATLNENYTITILDELVSKPYVDMTVRLLQLFGINIEVSNNLKKIKIYKSKLQGINYHIEPDATSATYFLAMGAINGSILIKNLTIKSIQGDKDFAEILRKMGTGIEYLEYGIRAFNKGDLTGISVDMNNMPDAAMTLAVLALFAKGKTTISGIQSWVNKETNRIVAMVTELRKFGAEIIVNNNCMVIIPPKKIKQPVAVDTYNDHRIAMAFSILLVGGVEVIINDYRCVDKTFVNYFGYLHTILNLKNPYFN